MNEPWFNPNLYAWIPGTMLGVLGGTWGALVGTLAPRGKAKRLVLASGWFLVAASAILLIAAVVALLAGQPYGVWYGLGLAGLIGLIVIGVNIPNVIRAYRMAEDRQMSARELGT
jgi:hypothetical protein